MAAIVKEYELSIWKDVWARPTLLDENGNVIKIIPSAESQDVLDEEKSAILSTDNFTFPGKATNIIFKTKINGTHELTFDLPGKYIDPSTGLKIKNYLVKLIDNETKVKLKYKDKWYSFYVKKVTEKREKNSMQYSYSCTDSFIVELSKTGYKITFNEYTEHYIEQIHEFADDILEGSEWKYNKQKTLEKCDLIEYQEEKLIEYTVGTTNNSVTLYKLKLKPEENSQQVYDETIDTPDVWLYETNDTITVPSGTVLYGFYSEFNQDVIDTYGRGTGVPSTRIKQVIYLESGNYDISGNTIIDKDCYYIIKESDISEGLTTPVFTEDHLYGLRICYNPYTEYNKETDRYVKRYTNQGSYQDNTPYYSYTKSRIMVPELATNYVANSKDMTDTTGWEPQYANDKLTVGKIDTGAWTYDQDTGLPTSFSSPNTYGIVAESLTVDSNVVRIINSGPYGRNLTIDAPTTFAFKIDYDWRQHSTSSLTTGTNDVVIAVNDDYTKAATATHNVTIKICQPVVDNIGDSYYKEIVKESSARDDDGNYCLNYFTPLFTISGVVKGQYYLLKITNSMLQSAFNGKISNLFIVIEISAPNGLQSCFCVKNMEFFEAWTYDGKHTKGNSDNVVSRLRSQSDIVPAYSTGWETSYDTTGTVEPTYNNDVTYAWMQNYINKLNSGTTDVISASQAYDQMEYQLEYWEQQHSGTDMQYTLITENSIVSGKAFDEELYFIVPTQPLFGDPIVKYIDPEATGYALEQWYHINKYRTLKQEKSNRFNLTQQLSELFHVYPVYDINYYPNGKIRKHLYTADGTEVTLDNADTAVVAYSRREKEVYYTEQKGGENKYGFKYGHNLSTISRTIDSTDIVTKMFVADNLNQYAKDGICTIARAQDNIGKDTYLLRFDYFINRGLISKDRIDYDLYSNDIRMVCTFNNFINSDNKYKDGLSRYDSYGNDIPISQGTGHTGYDYSSKIKDVPLYYGFLVTIGAINTRYDQISADQAILEKHQLIVLEASVQTYTESVKALREQLAKQKELASAYAKEEANKKWAEYVESCERIESKILTYEVYLQSAQALYEMYADLYNKYECEMHYLLWCKEQAETYFNTRYENLLREGVWSDSKYLEDNSYYLDAEKVSVDSCGPKITYNITVTDLSALKKYEFADFGVGDVTYIEDYEFFGDDLNSSIKFYQEKTIVAALTCNLDNPSKNSISLQNYTTKFDDLFSRVTASVQSLTFNENIYQRASRFTPSGQVDEQTLQNTLNENDLTIVGNQDVVIDGNGILVTDLRIPSNKVKIVGAGIYLSGNGGSSWYGAFENGGINASLLTVGRINTQSIVIGSSNHANFMWDENGITAYAVVERRLTNTVNDKTQYAISGSKYVRFNQYGLFFVQGETYFNKNNESGISAFEKDLEANKNQAAKFLKENASVAITYDGFSIKGAENKVSFTSEEGIIMKDNSGEVVVQLGKITGISGIKDFWGLRAKGAYIEGRLYSEKSYVRTASLGGQTGDVTAIDASRSMLYGGQFQIWRKITEQKIDEEQTDTAPDRKIVTFGSTLLTTSGKDSNDGDDVGISVEDYFSTIGGSIHIEEDGKFWSVGAYNREGSAGAGYYTKLIYAKDSVANFEANKFYVRCELVPQSIANTSDLRAKRDVSDIDERYVKLFDKLVPKLFNFNEETTDTPRHIGLIAQDVQKAREEVGLAQSEFGAVTPIKEQGYATVNYIEILTLAIAKIKQLENEINELKNNKTLEN